MKPKRIQLSGRKGWRKPANAVVVARPSRWGNRYAVGKNVQRIDGQRVHVPDRAHAVQLYREWLDRQLTESAALGDLIRRDLGGHDLACWCPLGGPCHADVLLEVANRDRS
jgi:hypothetical protein